ncbi:MAG: hypothetical protein IH944_01610 [Armatimonadetes bacterium]|nr:hypothetical protein [Armatimonadota bacterium]
MPIILIMLVKKAVYQLLAAGPFLLLGLIAISGRTSANAYEFIEYGPAMNDSILAYVDPVRVSVAYESEAKQSPNRQQLLEAIEFWLTAYRNGELKDIRPATTILDGRTSAYTSILDARSTLLRDGYDLANEWATLGQYEDAANLYGDLIELANVAKYGDFSSLIASAPFQMRILGSIEAISSELDEAQRTRLASQIEELEQPGRNPTQIVNHMAVVYSRDLRRKGESTNWLAAVRSSHTLASNDEEEFKLEEWIEITSSDQDLLPLAARSRVALSQERRYRERRDSVLNQLLANEQAE